MTVVKALCERNAYYSVHELNLNESPCYKLVITLTRDVYGTYKVIFPVIIT